jgi:paraquat-inducible protein B
MAELPPIRSEDFPAATPATPARWAPSLVWLIPFVAVLIGGWLAVKAILERGPTISITFATAEGLEEAKTKIKYISLAPDLSRVIVTAAMTKEATSLLASDTRFWVVGPRVTASSVSGLSTLLSGPYIGIDVGRSDQRSDAFIGLDAPPQVTGDKPGRQFVLESDDLGSLDIGSPIYFRRIQAGQVIGYSLEEGGNKVQLSVFIDAPYDNYVKDETRFWHASGFDVSVDAQGLTVVSQSLVSILIGGLAFETPSEFAQATSAAPNTTFRLYANRSLAMRLRDTRTEDYVMLFDESVRGLSVGAPVDFRGITIGEVTNIATQYNRETGDLRMEVAVQLFPDRVRGRLGSPLPEIADPADSKARMDRAVGRGLRAQLRTANLLTGQLYIALDFFPDAQSALMDWSQNPPAIPTSPASLSQLQDAIARIASKLDKVPFDTIGADLKRAAAQLERTLASADTLLHGFDTELAPEAKETLVDVRTMIEEGRAMIADGRATLNAAQQTLAFDAPLQADLRATLYEVTRAAEALRILAEAIERQPDVLIRGRKENEP